MLLGRLEDEWIHLPFTDWLYYTCILTAKQNTAKGSESFASLDLTKSLSMFLISPFGLLFRKGFFREMWVNYKRYFLLYACFKIFYYNLGFLRKKWCQHYLEELCEWKHHPSAVLYKAGITMYLHPASFLPAHTKGEMGPKGQSGVPGHRGPIGRPGKRGKQVGPWCFLFAWLMASVWSWCTTVRSVLSWYHALYRTGSRQKRWNTSHACTG